MGCCQSSGSAVVRVGIVPGVDVSDEGAGETMGEEQAVACLPSSLRQLLHGVFGVVHRALIVLERVVALRPTLVTQLLTGRNAGRDWTVLSGSSIVRAFLENNFSYIATAARAAGVGMPDGGSFSDDARMRRRRFSVLMETTFTADAELLCPEREFKERLVACAAAIEALYASCADSASTSDVEEVFALLRDAMATLLSVLRGARDAWAAVNLFVSEHSVPSLADANSSFK